MQMEYRFSLTPRLVAVGIFSLVALFVLLFLLGMQVGLKTARPAEAPAPAAAASAPADPLAAAQKKLADTEAALKAPAAGMTPTAAPAAEVKH